MSDRRVFLKLLGMASLAPVSALAGCNVSTGPRALHRVQVRLRRISVAPQLHFESAAYDEEFMTAPLRVPQGQPLLMDVHNTAGQSESFRCTARTVALDGCNGGAQSGPCMPHELERRTYSIAPGTQRRMLVMTDIPGAHLYQSDQLASSLLQSGPYSAQKGVVLVEPRTHAGDYDREYVLVMSEFGPWLQQGPAGFEVRYCASAVNGRMLGCGAPLRVRHGERVLLHLLNASASETRYVALPGHVWRVLTIDGHPLPAPCNTASLRLGAGERVTALVEMRSPGVWILGEIREHERRHGLGIVVEYAGSRGPARWQAHPQRQWDYAQLAPVGRTAGSLPPAQPLRLQIARVHVARGFARFSINGEIFSPQSAAAFRLECGRRYRLHLDNASASTCCLHLPEHPFQLPGTGVAWQTPLTKEVLVLERGQRLVADITPRARGHFLLHCRRQLQRDFGLAARIEVI